MLNTPFADSKMPNKLFYISGEMHDSISSFTWTSLKQELFFLILSHSTHIFLIQLLLLSEGHLNLKICDKVYFIVQKSV